MPILAPQDEDAIRQRFQEELDGDVRLTLITHNPIGGLIIPGRDCASCDPAQQLAEEVSALSPKITMESVDFYRDPDRAAELGVDKIPALLVRRGESDSVRFFGLPSGHEFPVFLDAIVSASTGNSGLSEETLGILAELEEDVHIQVFVTPT
jgi:alkyl hydroperoxide reductase subunit AhpF